MRMLPVFVVVACACLVAADDKKPSNENLLKPTNDIESWRFEEHEGGKGELKADEEMAVLRVAATTGTDWHLQAFRVGLDLQEGKEYVLTFQAKSPERRGMIINAQIDEEDWHEIGLHEEVYTTNVEFKEYKYTFKAEGVVKGNNRLGFVLGNEKGTLIVKDMKLVEKK